MWWLRLVGSLKVQVSSAKEPYKKRQYSAKQTYNFKGPTNRSHPIAMHTHSCHKYHAYVTESILQESSQNLQKSFQKHQNLLFVVSKLSHYSHYSQNPNLPSKKIRPAGGELLIIFHRSYFTDDTCACQNILKTHKKSDICHI